MRPESAVGYVLWVDYFLEHQRVVEKTAAILQAPACEVGNLLVTVLGRGNKVIVFGNGGSATHASHFAGELMGRFARRRCPLPAVALPSDPGILTCISNDFGYGEIFRRQIEALAQPGDLALALSSSGRSENVLSALRMASQKRAITVALTGAAGLVDGTADYVLNVPSTVTACIQEVHLMLLHVWCMQVDQAFES